MFNLPPSFVIVTIAFVIWLASIVLYRERHHGTGHDPATSSIGSPTEVAEVGDPL